MGYDFSRFVRCTVDDVYSLTDLIVLSKDFYFVE